MGRNDKLSGMRRQYRNIELLESQAPESPQQLLHEWLDQAIAHEVPPIEANAMTLATVDEQGQPHCRIVSLKRVDERGLVFYSHHSSVKGQDLAGNPRAALLFYWPTLERQLRIEGEVERISAEESDRYFNSRPLFNRLACWASEQSQVITDRGELEARLALAKCRFLGSVPTRPADWGGYRVLPLSFEFWQGRAHRLHDRLRYRRLAEGWLRERLSP